MLNGAFHPPKPNTPGFKIVHIGLDRLPFSILDMASLFSKSWQKSTCFDSLAKAMRVHMDTLSIPDLVTVVSTEIPIDSTIAYVEASDINKLVTSSVSCVSNLTGIVLLNSTGGATKAPALIQNKDRPKDLAFIRLSCTINASTMDNRI